MGAAVAASLCVAPFILTVDRAVVQAAALGLVEMAVQGALHAAQAMQEDSAEGEI